MSNINTPTCPSLPPPQHPPTVIPRNDTPASLASITTMETQTSLSVGGSTDGSGRGLLGPPQSTLSPRSRPLSASSSTVPRVRSPLSPPDVIQNNLDPVCLQTSVFRCFRFSYLLFLLLFSTFHPPPSIIQADTDSPGKCKTLRSISIVDAHVQQLELITDDQQYR